MSPKRPLAIFCQVLLLVLVQLWPHQASALAGRPIDPQWSLLSAPLGEIFIHETGHAVTMLSLGVGVSSFRPFPHFCHGKFVGGCVVSGSRFGSGLLPFLSNRSKDALISASGSLFSIIGVLSLAPQIPKIKNEFNRKTIEDLTYLQVLDFPFYVIADILGFDGDWSNVSSKLGISILWFVPVAAGQYFFLSQYWQHYYDKAAEIYDYDGTEKKADVKRIFWLPPIKFKL